MNEKVPHASMSGDELERLPAFEESMAHFGMGNLDYERGVILKDWSAQDFANIYVRFRPHLMRHAWKFLREETQAEEVVQDAFLYLMTALPELDSELGVLRFLKWKTKMLCLDIIRSSKTGLNSNLVPLFEDLPDETQLHDSLERADDAAIIRMALAKLNPRHREALIATMYEEKSHEEVAQQMGVGENAFRQLLFRARASFRQALVGEAEIEGKSVPEILATAARKAASARNLVVVALITFASLSISPMVGNNVQLAGQDEVRVAMADNAAQRAPETPSSNSNSSEEVPAEGAIFGEQVSGEESDLGATDFRVDNGEGSSSNYGVVTGSSQSNPEESEMSQARDAFNEALGENLVIGIAAQGMRVLESSGQLTADNQSGLRASFAIDLNSQGIVQYLLIEFESAGQVWKAVPGNSLSVVEEVDGQTRVSYAATDFLVGDFSGEFDFVSTSESVFSRSGIKLDLVLDGGGGVVTSNVTFLPNA